VNECKPLPPLVTVVGVYPRVMAWQAMLAPSSTSTRNLNPRFLSPMTSYDLASNVCQTLARHVIDTRCEPLIIGSNGML
jgi:hypothetical protein